MMKELDLQEKLSAVEEKYEEGAPFNFLAEVHAKNCARIAHILQTTPQELKGKLNYSVAVIREALLGIFLKDKQ